MTREQYVTKKIDVDGGVGLEIGPLTRPIVKKPNNIFYLDHMSTAQLRRKYENEPIDPNDIVEVDFIYRNNLKRSVNNKTFDYVIAAHVIEHIPDIISWLKDVQSILKPGGILSLIVPDKRYTFDIFRDESTVADIMGAYFDKLNMPTGAMMYDYASSYVIDIDAQSIWRDLDYYIKLPPKKRWDNHDVVKMCKANKEGKYIDCHCHVFTPQSFADILRAVIGVGLLDFEVCSFVPTPTNDLEFFVSLKKVTGTTAIAKRVSKIPKPAPTSKEVIMEQQKQIEALKLDNEQLEQANTNLRNSLSWRLTEPLRRASKAYKGFNN